jgi:ADP-ribose pyrophosphatase
MDGEADRQASWDGEEIVSSRRIFSGRIIEVRVDEVRLSDGRCATREVVEHPGAVAIVPLMEDGRALLVRQYRLPAGQFLLEVPAGTMREGEAPEQCARRELEEEVGFCAGRMIHLASFYTAPGFCTEMMHCYLCRDLSQTRPAPDLDERIEVEPVPISRAGQMARKGLIRDAKTIVSILLAEEILKAEELEK